MKLRPTALAALTACNAQPRGPLLSVGTYAEVFGPRNLIAQHWKLAAAAPAAEHVARLIEREGPKA